MEGEGGEGGEGEERGGGGASEEKIWDVGERRIGWPWEEVEEVETAK